MLRLLEGRVRRAAPPVTCKVKDKVCHLLLVADYRFFKEIGNRDITATRRYLVSYYMIPCLHYLTYRLISGQILNDPFSSLLLMI